jgi:hypothetical protein
MLPRSSITSPAARSLPPPLFFKPIPCSPHQRARRSNGCRWIWFRPTWQCRDRR